MRKVLALLVALIMTASVLPLAAAEGAEWTVRTAPVMQGENRIGSLDLRFYAASPHVAYYGMKAYLAFMRGQELTVTPQDGGVWEVTGPEGTPIRVDPAAGTITAADWARFQNQPVPYRTIEGVKDSPCAWSWYSELGYDDEPAAVVFDFAKYGIAVYADEEDVWLPLAILSTMFTDVATNHVTYNGETVFRSELDLSSLGSVPASYYDTERMRALFSGEEKRAEDEIREDYGELCFIVDYFFGHPGTSVLDAPVRENGLDESLKANFGDIREALLSDDMQTYMIGLQRLFGEGLDDGHTAFSSISALAAPGSVCPDLVPRLMLEAPASVMMSGAYRGALLNAVRATRDAAWGGEFYRECGSTAIIRLNDFNPDAKGWEAYYAGTGDIPTDTLGVTVTGLKRASENPEIKYILFDLSANAGGSGDILMAVLDLCTGENVFRGYNVLTGQHEYAVMHTDKNLDGVFDEKDDEVKYDFRYAVLTSRVSFSCGNLFPFLMQEHGAVLLGEPTGGGSCCVQFATLSGGAEFMMSSYLWALRSETGANVEDGCLTDLPIGRIEAAAPNNPNPRLTMGDYSPYFDDEMLDRMIDEWFAAQEEAPAA